MVNFVQIEISYALFILSSFLLLLSRIAATSSLLNRVSGKALINDKSHLFATDGSDAYLANRDLVLSELMKQSSVTQFYNTSAGNGDDKSFGVYYCRIDATSEDCAACVKAAVNSSTVEFPYYVDVTYWYVGCTLRYTDHSTYKLFEDKFWVTFYSSDSSVDQTTYYSVMSNTMSGLITKAVNDKNLYAVGRGEVSTTSETVHCFVQCRPDIIPADCEECLNRALSNTTSFSLSRFVAQYRMNCQLVYDYQPFLNGTFDSSPPPPDHSRTNSPPPPDSSKDSSPPPPDSSTDPPPSPDSSTVPPPPPPPDSSTDSPPPPDSSPPPPPDSSVDSPPPPPDSSTVPPPPPDSNTDSPPPPPDSSTDSPPPPPDSGTPFPPHHTPSLPDIHVPRFQPSGAHSLTGGFAELIKINTSMAVLILLFVLTLN